MLQRKMSKLPPGMRCLECVGDRQDAAACVHRVLLARVPVGGSGSASSA